MPRKYTITYREAASPITEPVTKFGGQPVWVDEPCWPLSRMSGSPMEFICQIRLLPELFGDLEAEMAYIFISGNEADYTWDPDRGENAVVLQPGGRWDRPMRALWEGSTLHKGTGAHRRSCEFSVQLRPGDDPDAFTWTSSMDAAAREEYYVALAEDKVGGTPVPIDPDRQLVSWPGRWALLMQLSAKFDKPFTLNFGPDGVGYAFVSKDGRTGRFLWSR